jgi:hypothetical protein
LRLGVHAYDARPAFRMYLQQICDLCGLADASSLRRIEFFNSTGKELDTAIEAHGSQAF